MPKNVQEELRAAALSARSRAYAPYTKFDAGASVLDSDGQIHTGAIVENISLGLAMCAERVALFNCASAGGRPSHLVVAAPSTDGGLTLPCGACLQVALELGGPEVTVTAVSDEDGSHTTMSLLELLPRGPHRSSTGI